MILSVSRRTDIPAFYAEWFMERLRQKYVLVRNPFNYHLISKIPLTPENIDVIVFWTKNSKPIHRYLDEIDDLGYKYYFQYTITPYKKDMEENIQDKKEIIKNFQYLADKIGSEKVILRYDPVILTSSYNTAYHKKAFEKLCRHLNGYTKKIIISFIDYYNNTYNNIKAHNVYNIADNDMYIIAENFTETADKYNIIVTNSCPADSLFHKNATIKFVVCTDIQQKGDKVLPAGYYSPELTFPKNHGYREILKNGKEHLDRLLEALQPGSTSQEKDIQKPLDELFV